MIDSLATLYCDSAIFTVPALIPVTYRQVAKVIDPDQSLFQSRIVSRDDCPDLAGQKSLQRLFPGGIEMALILDDTPKVWQVSFIWGFEERRSECCMLTEPWCLVVCSTGSLVLALRPWSWH
jgi:TFIIF-interacting CTD phosphatase-like protein